jgi:hypothetical protein
MSVGERVELRRIADALERIAKALEAKKETDNHLRATDPVETA